MTNPKVLFAKESVNLIKKLTGFTEDEENFGICENFVLSNLLYHSFLDPVPSKVEAHYEGLARKWEIHAKEEKASRLKTLLQKFISDPLFNSSDEPQRQFDIHIRMLSLIYNLSYSDTVEVSPFGSDEDTLSKSLSTEPSSEKPPNFWLDLLKAGEDPPKRLSDEDELSIWSEDDGDNTSNNSDDLPLDKTSPSKALPICLPQPINYEQKRTVIDPTSLSKEIQPRYWKGSLGTFNSLPHSFLSAHERLCEKIGIPRCRITVLTEYQVIREVLWMLRSPSRTGSLIFKTNDDSKFFVHPGISLPSLAGNSLVEALSLYTSTLDDIYTLQEFTSACSSKEDIPHTYEAYGEHLDLLLRRLSASLITIEDTVSKQEVTYTLLDLENDTKEVRKLIRFVVRVHARGIVHEGGENWYRAIRLISVLNETVSGVFKDNEVAFAVEGLLRTLKPYLRIANTWIHEGRLEDWRNEFVYVGNPELDGKKNEHFWEEAFLMRDYEERLLHDGIRPPAFLPFKKIHISGKSRHILIFLDYVPSGSINNTSTSMYDEFLERMRSLLTPLDVPKPKLQHEAIVPDSSSIVDDPYLALAFKEVEEMSNVPEEPLEIHEGEFLLSGYALDTLKSFEPIIFSSLDPIIDKHYSASCQRILTFFKDELNLQRHLSSIRKVFLMEDGDLLEEFYTEIFHKLQERDSLFFDVSNLTLHLRGCLSQRSSTHSPDLFGVSISKKNGGDILDQLTLSYRLSWPLDIVITGDHFALYNKVFQFLLKVKRALWALKVINPMDIACHPKRILLLRSWLFHFVGSIHSHLMTRVLHSTEVELNNRLSGSCKDLDDVVALHSDYIKQIVDRCFLNSHTSILRNTVLKVLQICGALKDLVLSGGGEEDVSATLDNMEEVYSRSHQFLAITLRSIVQKRNLPHLESLAVALIHSCPEAL